MKNRGDKKITKLALKNYNDCGNQIFQKNRRIKKTNFIQEILIHFWENSKFFNDLYKIIDTIDATGLKTNFGVKRNQNCCF